MASSKKIQHKQLTYIFCFLYKKIGEQNKVRRGIEKEIERLEIENGERDRENRERDK
jgi:hypothetical protein